MGAQQSSQPQRFKKSLQTSSLKNQYSQQYGSYFAPSNSSSTIIKQYTLTSEDEQKSFSILIDMYTSFDLPTILEIRDSRKLTDVQKNYYGWSLEFQFLGVTLEEEIASRRKMNKDRNTKGILTSISQQGSPSSKNNNKSNNNSKWFLQSEILYLIDCVLSALMGFNFKKLTHGDINASKIFKKLKKNDDKDFVYCIGLPLLLTPETRNKKIQMEDIKRDCLAPQFFEQLQNGFEKPRKNQRSDVFSLGTTIMEMATLSPTSDIYDLKKKRIDEEKLKRKMFQCRSKYSQKFCQLLEKMLSISPRDRPDFSDTYNILAEMIENNSESSQNSQRKNLQRKEIQESRKRQNNVLKQIFHVQSPQLNQCMFVSHKNERAWQNYLRRHQNQSKDLVASKITY